jgi:DNA repair exonuclease SbcCD ATPase subunit
MAQHLLFTHELLLASGCEDNPRTRKMVDILNGISVLWGREVMFYLEKIVNTVKSKTDELRSVLDFGAPDAPQTAQQCTPDQKIKRLEDEIQKNIQNLKKLGEELQTQKDMNKDLRKAVVIQERNFRAFIKSYNARCLELDSQKDEAGRHSVWFNEQMLSLNQNKAAMGNSITKKDKEIAELQSKLVATGSLQVTLGVAKAAIPSLQVILKLFRCDFCLFRPLPQEPILHDLTAEGSVENPQKEDLLQKSQLLMHDFISEQKKKIDVIAAMEDTIMQRLVVNIICVFILIHILTHPIH